MESDYFGIVSAKKVPDKFIRSGFHATRSEYVQAPLIDEYPLTMECELKSIEEGPEELRVLGIIKNVMAAETVLGEDGKMDVAKLHAIVWDNFKAGYYRVGEKVGQSFQTGRKLI